MLLLLSFAFDCCRSNACADVVQKKPPDLPQLPTHPVQQNGIAPPPRSSRVGDPIQIEDVDGDGFTGNRKSSPPPPYPAQISRKRKFMHRDPERSSFPPLCDPPQCSRKPFLSPQIEVGTQPKSVTPQPSDNPNDVAKWMEQEFGWNKEDIRRAGLKK